MVDINGLEELSGLLKKQLEAQKRLLELEKNKTDVLVHGDIEGLDMILKREQALVMSSAALEKKREALQKKNATSGMTLKEIVLTCADMDSFGLQNIFEDMSHVLTELKKTARVNTGILNSRLVSINKFVSLLGMQKTSLTYKKDGHFEL